METTTVNVENMIKWLKRLKSGKDKQGRFFLNKVSPSGESSYCCLGILCEVAMENGLVIAKKPDVGFDHNINNEYVKIDIFQYNGDGDLQPREVSHWLGLGNIRNVLVTHEGEQALISRLNDINQLTFSEIADLLFNEYLAPLGIDKTLIEAADVKE
jgi:hypothetical protein